ncbi:MAG: cyclase family protein [Acidimicrobiia bacterium]
MSEYIEMSHEIVDGMTTYPGIPAPAISTFLTFDDSQDHYAEGTEFQIGRIDLAANTGTYLDTPAHRHRDGWDLTGLRLDRIANVPGVVARCRDHSQRAIGPEVLKGLAVGGSAVLFDTGWSEHWGTDAYFRGHPYLDPATVDALVAAAPAIVGIDSLNIDGTDRGTRPAHTLLLKADIPIVEHMTGLDRLPDTGFRFFAVPPRIAGLATFPVRAFAISGS